MIAHLRGTVAALTLDSAVLDVAGVGYLVRCTPATVSSLRLNQETQLATSMVVREDSMTLYGFGERDERDMFELLQTASGVGPKVAQAMLAVLEPERLRAAIAAGDLAALTSVPGIGRKGAERIVLELRDKVGRPGSASVDPSSAAGAPWREQVQEALLGLGWSAKDADKAVEKVAAELEPGADESVSTLLRLALRSLSKA
jgi:Holliday junction DNA helicase RuvA